MENGSSSSSSSSSQPLLSAAFLHVSGHSSHPGRAPRSRDWPTSTQLKRSRDNRRSNSGGRPPRQWHKPLVGLMHIGLPAPLDSYVPLASMRLSLSLDGQSLPWYRARFRNALFAFSGGDRAMPTKMDEYQSPGVKLIELYPTRFSSPAESHSLTELARALGCSSRPCFG